MQRIFLLLLIVVTSTAFANGPNVSSRLSPNAVSTSVSWKNKGNLDVDLFLTKFFEVLSDEYYIERFDKAYEEIISTREDPKRGSKVEVKKMYFFVKPVVNHFPEALVTFKVTTTTYNKKSKDPKIKLFPSVTIILDSPFQLYTDYFDFAIDKFDSSSISLMISAKSNGATWGVSMSFSLKSLFLISWLSSVKKALKLQEEPKVHSTLLFFKQRFDHLGNALFKALK